MKLRPAEIDDWALLYAWRSDPQTMASMTDQKPFTLAEHMKWLRKALADDTIMLFVGRDDAQGHNVGTVRLDVQKNGRAECSVTVDPALRGRGYGRQLIAAVVHEAVDAHLDKLVATIKNDNHASLRAFADNVFKPVKFTDEYVTLERQL